MGWWFLKLALFVAGCLLVACGVYRHQQREKQYLQELEDYGYLECDGGFVIAVGSSQQKGLTHHGQPHSNRRSTK